MNDKITKLEELKRSIEKEKNIDKQIDIFTQGAALAKDVLAELEKQEGKVYKVIKGVNKYMEEEWSPGEDDNDEDNE